MVVFVQRVFVRILLGRPPLALVLGCPRPPWGPLRAVLMPLHRENFGRNQNEQLPIVAVNFPKYLEEKLGYLENWSLIKKLMYRFTAHWLVEHITFLYHYKGKGTINLESLDLAQKKVFAIDYIKPLKFKFFLKNNFRSLHDLIVTIKSKFIHA